jgi:hypothetical protein
MPFAAAKGKTAARRTKAVPKRVIKVMVVVVGRFKEWLAISRGKGETSEQRLGTQMHHNGLYTAGWNAIMRTRSKTPDQRGNLR